MQSDPGFMQVNHDKVKLHVKSCLFNEKRILFNKELDQTDSDSVCSSITKAINIDEDKK